MLARINILILLCALSCSAQLPIIQGSVAIQNPSSFDPNAISGLFVELLSDNTTSLTNTSNGSSIASWINLKFLGDTTFQNWIPAGTVGFTGPTYSNNGGPTGQACINWNGCTTVQLKCQGIFGTNQPFTLFAIFNPVNLASLRVVADQASGGGGGRVTLELDGSNNAYFAGSTAFGPTSRNAWQLYSVVINGANSYLRTNGVLSVTGTSGANSMGQWALGNDITLASQFVGKMACILAYNGALNTNDLQTVEVGLKNRFFNGVYP